MRRLLLPLLAAVAGLALPQPAAAPELLAPPPKWEREGLPAPFAWVDAAARISVAKAFVSKAERDHILALIQGDGGGWAPSSTGGAGFMAPASSARFKAAVRRDPVITRLEARIANATGTALFNPPRIFSHFSVAVYHLSQVLSPSSLTALS